MTTTQYPTPSQVLQGMLATLVYAYGQKGIPVDVRPGGDHYNRAVALAGRVSIAIANGQLSLANSNPLTATGQPLKTLAAIFGVFPRPPGPASGGVLMSFTGSFVPIPDNWFATIGGSRYTAAPGTYTTTSIQLVATVPGSAGNQVAGALGTWESAAIGSLGAGITVDSNGIIDGSDGDDPSLPGATTAQTEAFRARLLEKLSAPTVGGNWSSVRETAEDADAAVQAAYVYGAALGADSVAVCATAAGGTRQLSEATLATILAALVAFLPGQVTINLTTPVPTPIDISIALSLPSPVVSGGLGGGWRDPNPWPIGEDVHVTAYNAGTGTATVLAANSPSAGGSIGVWDPTFTDPTTGAIGVMREYTILTVGGSIGAWTITVQPSGGGSGFIVSPLGAYISTGAQNLVQYARTFADAAALLTPGEVTDIPELLPIAQREPIPTPQAPASLTSSLLSLLQQTYGEIGDFAWGIRYATGTTVTTTDPPIPNTTGDPPAVLTLANLAFRMK